MPWPGKGACVTQSSYEPCHVGPPKTMGHSEELWQNMDHWRRKWQPTALSLLREPQELLSSVAQLCLTLCHPMDCSMPGLPVHHQLLELAQTHVHWVGEAIQPSHPLSSPSLPDFNLCQHQGLSQRVSSSHQVAKVLEFHLESFQWIFRTDFL